MPTPPIRIYRAIAFLPFVLVVFGWVFIAVNQSQAYYFPAIWTGAVGWISLGILSRKLQSEKTAPEGRLYSFLRICGALAAILTGVFAFFVPCIQMPGWKGTVAVIYCLLLIITGLVLLTVPLLYRKHE